MSGEERNPNGEPPDLADAMRERSALLGLAYRLLGSIADAEDAVQETYIRWYRLSEEERGAIESPRAWLLTAAGRICLDMLKSARARRERYVGQWLPEPLPSEEHWTSQARTGPADPADRVTLDESVSMAMMVVLESMTPAERVAFVLHDVFRFTFPEIAEIVGRTPGACRQLASSARRRIEADRGTLVSDAEHAEAVRTFKEAWESGDLAALIEVLDPEASAITDGGGIVSASLEPLTGAEQVARFLLGVLDRQPDLELREEMVNGEPGLVATDGGGGTLAVLALRASGPGRIGRLLAVRNPGKLAIWG